MYIYRYDADDVITRNASPDDAHAWDAAASHGSTAAVTGYDARRPYDAAYDATNRGPSTRVCSPSSSALYGNTKHSSGIYLLGL